MYRFRVEGGEPERLDFAGDNPYFLDVARTGHRLAFTRLRRDVNLYRAALGPDGTLVGEGQPVARSSRREYHAVISPDGTRIAFSSTRSGCRVACPCHPTSRRSCIPSVISAPPT